jgi:hypothetical protein
MRAFFWHLSLQVVLNFFLLGWSKTLIIWPISGVFYQPQTIDDDEYGSAGEMGIDKETEVLGVNLPQCLSVRNRSHLT